MITITNRDNAMKILRAVDLREDNKLFHLNSKLECEFLLQSEDFLWFDKQDTMLHVSENEHEKKRRERILG